LALVTYPQNMDSVTRSRPITFGVDAKSGSTNAIQIRTLVGRRIVAKAARRRHNLRLSRRLTSERMMQGDLYSYFVALGIRSVDEGAAVGGKMDQGQKANAAAVKAVSIEFEKVLVEQKACQGLRMERASCHECVLVSYGYEEWSRDRSYRRPCRWASRTIDFLGATESAVVSQRGENCLGKLWGNEE